METTRNLRVGVWILWVVLLLIPSARVDAEVSVYGADAGDGPMSVLSTRVIIEDDEPIGSAWQTLGGSSGGTVLNGDGDQNGDGEPSITLHPETGEALAVWAQAGPSSYDIVLSRFTSGAWTAPEVLAGSSADELDPFLVIDPADGSVHLLYWVHDVGPRVMQMQAPADLSDWSTAVQVSSPGEIAVRPAAAFAQGSLKVVYERHDLGYGSTPRQIVLATRVGSSFSTESVGLSYAVAENWPEIHTRGGRLWIDWVHGPDAMAWTVWGPGGWEAMQIEGFNGTEDRTFRVRGRIELQALD